MLVVNDTVDSDSVGAHNFVCSSISAFPAMVCTYNSTSISENARTTYSFSLRILVYYGYMYRARSKRAERRRLILTYTLVPVFVVGVVTLLVLYMLGYRFSLADQTVSQGGLIQLDSQPTGADVTVDTYKLPGRTTTRYDATAGLHTVTMARDGYVPWQKTVTVEPGKVLWLNYARLIPREIQQSSQLSFDAIDSSVAAPNRQAIVAIPDDTKPALSVISLEDTVRQTDVTLPSSLYTSSKASRFAVAELSETGRYALVKHTYGSKFEWLFVDTRTASRSRNITAIVGQQTPEPLFAVAGDLQLYVVADNNLRIVDVDRQTVSAPIVGNVAEVSQSSQGIVSYVSRLDSTKKQRVAGYYTPGANKPHTLRTFYDDGKTVLRLRIADYVGDTYVVLQYGTSIEISTTRLPSSENEEELQLTSVATLAAPDGVEYLSFSPNARFVIGQHASTYMTYDLELNSLATTSLKGSSAVKNQLSWLDNYYVWSDRDNALRLYEFDGANAHTIGTIAAGQAVTLSNDNRYIYSFVPNDDATSIALVRFQLRVQQ
jgi:hypothetical protein